MKRQRHLLLVALLLLFQALAFGKSLEVQAGPFAYFGIELPRTMVAGENYTVTLTAYDTYGNRTDYFGETEHSFALNTTGSAAVEPSRLSSGMFSSGSVVLTLSGRITEASTFSISEGNKPLLVKDEATGKFVTHFNLNIGHGPLSAFELALPKELIVGEPFVATITAIDGQGNTVTDYGNTGEGATVVVEGESGKRSFAVPAHAFNGGIATFPLRYDNAEAVRISVTDQQNSKAMGRFGPVTLIAQTLTRIEIKTPASIRAGVLFPLELKVYNQFGRLMRNYATVGSDIILGSNGSGQLIPDRVPAAAFVEGVAHFETLYTKPEAIDITATPASEVSGGHATDMVVAKTAEPLVKKTERAAPKITPMPEAKVEQKAKKVAAAPAAKKASPAAPAGEEGYPLALRFSSDLGKIERIESEYTPRGKLGTTRVMAYFANGSAASEVQPLQKAIKAKGRVIGTLSIDGKLDKKGRLIIWIKEKEPFTVDIKSKGSTLSLRFFLPS